jgi:predicted alpha/beta hydrolase family esterase
MNIFERFEPSSWDKPELSNWTDAVDRVLLATKTLAVLVAHSLSCLLVALSRSVRRIDSKSESAQID